MPKHLKLRDSTNTNSLCKLSHEYDETSSEESSPLRDGVRKRKIQKSVAARKYNVDSDEEDRSTNLDNWSPEIQNLVQSLQSKIHEAVHTKTQKIRDHTSEKLFQNIVNISDSFTSMKEKIDKLCSSFNQQCAAEIQEMEEESTRFDEQVSKSITVLEETLKSFLEYKCYQKRKLQHLEEIGIKFFKNLDGHQQEMKKQSNVSLNKLKRGLHTAQKNLAKKRQEETLDFRKSFAPLLW